MEIAKRRRGRPRNPPIAYDPEAVDEFIKRLFTIENEINTLREDKKELKDEFKSKVNAKLIGQIVRLVKLQIDLNSAMASPETIDEIAEKVRDKVGMVLPNG